MGVPILCYHRVHTAADAPAVPADGYCGHVEVDAFRRHMEALAERGFRTATHKELAAWLLDGKRLPERSHALSCHCPTPRRPRLSDARASPRPGVP